MKVEALALRMVLGACALLASLSARAESKMVSYWDPVAKETITVNADVVTKDTTKLYGLGWYVVEGAVSCGQIEAQSLISGSYEYHVNLILADGCELKVTGANNQAGLAIRSGNLLTIYGQTAGTGKLTAKGGDSGAGIGGDSEGACGTVTINGGTVTATGGAFSAGIGGGSKGACGTVTINGGTVTATGDQFSAGIGEVNAQLCEGNPGSMFVTCWIGVLDEQTGALSYVNAGHDLPYLRRADGSVTCLEGLSGMPFGAWEGLDYPVFETKLEPGDALLLYTDGVVEAKSEHDGMFGEPRLEELLARQRSAGTLVSPGELCQLTYDAVVAFSGNVAQFDDITVLALRYRGLPRTERLDVPARVESFEKVMAFAEGVLDGAGCPKAVKSNLLVSLDEIVSNIARYSGSERMTISVELARYPSVVRFVISDTGKPWNPLEHRDPDITLSADKREIGGLGILMVKGLMDDVSYVREHGRNILRFRKQL